ncbi:MAG: 2-keto-4-methylthiobutyrate aminotransferase [Dehalococcoidia bacterium]|nr:MAG: 2-keto-4-methylthiobutyrate aminotransferase [Dehalococcoidia bacterium]
MPEALIWVNGQIVTAGTPALDPRDRGFLLADGLYEVVRVRRGRAVALPLHLARLAQGAALLALPLPPGLEAAVMETIAANQLEEGMVRLVVSRGVASQRGLLPAGDESPTVVIQALSYRPPSPELYQRGVAAIVSSLRRNERSPLTQVKSLAATEQVLARMEAVRQGYPEAILLNTRGRVAGATAANLFAVVDGTVLTPPAAEGALPGILRQRLLSEVAPACGVPATSAPLPLARLIAAQEAFLTSVLIGILPLTNLAGQPIGRGQPGPVTRQLAATLADNDCHPLG